MAELLLEAGVILATLVIAGTVARRLDQSVIPFYVLSGIAMSTYVLGRVEFAPVARYAIEMQDYITLLAELGIVFLLFFLGLEFSLERMLASKEEIGKAGTVDLLVNLPVGVAIGVALGWSPLEAFVLGGVVYISSSAVITKSLIDLGWIANAEAEPMLGTLVFEDLVIAFYLAVLSAVLIGGGEFAEILADVGVAMAFLLVLVSAVYFGADHFERFLDVDSQEMFVLRAVAVTVFVAGFALAIGVSEAVAAFFVGMGFATTGHTERIEHLLAPLRDAFAAVFFFGIGLATDPRAVLGVAGILALVVALTAPAKVLSGYVNGRTYGLSPRRSLRVGLGLVARGEFSLVIATVAAAGTGLTMTRTIPALAVGYVLVMSLLGTGLMSATDRIDAAVFDRRF